MRGTPTTEEAAHAGRQVLMQNARALYRIESATPLGLSGRRLSESGSGDRQMVAAYVLVSVEPGKNEPVVSALREMPR